MSTRVHHTPFNTIRCFRMSQTSQLLSPHTEDGDGHSTEYGSEGKCSLVATEIHKYKQRDVLKRSRVRTRTLSGAHLKLRKVTVSIDFL